MYRMKDIMQGLKGLVGFEQDYDPAKHIDEDLTQTESGLYFQGAHPMVTLNLIRQNMPLEWLMQYPAWSDTSVYPKGFVVKSDNKTWESAENNNSGNAPGASSAWREYDYFSAYLRRQVRDGIGTMVQRFIRDKMANKLAPEMLLRKTFYDGAGYIYDNIPNNGNIVGFEIVPRRAMGVVTKIERVGLQMRGASGKLTLYLFHSNSIEPIASQDVNIDGSGSFQWFTMQDWFLPYIGGNDAGGSWFVCYDQDAMPAGMEAINVCKDFSKSPKASTCCGNLGRYQDHKQLNENIEFYPFNNDGSLATPEMWDITRNIYPGCISYGMNIEVTVGCDLTDFIVSQRLSFATCLQKQVAANLMKRMAFNPDERVNHAQMKISADRMNYELDGEPGKQSTFQKDLNAEYAALDINTQGIDKVCLPCKRNGVRIVNA